LFSVQRIMIQDKHCFEMYGYDILIDSNLKPWLLEINASPSLTASSKEDYRMKFNLLNDLLTIVDMEGNLTGKEDQVGGFDIIYRGKPNSGPVTSYGGKPRVSSGYGCLDPTLLPPCKLGFYFFFNYLLLKN